MSKRKREEEETIVVDLTQSYDSKDEEESEPMEKRKRFGRYFLVPYSKYKIEYCYEFNIAHPLFFNVLHALHSKGFSKAFFFSTEEPKIALLSLLTNVFMKDQDDDKDVILLDLMPEEIQSHLMKYLEVDKLDEDDFYGLLKEKIKWETSLNKIIIQNNVIYIKTD